MKTEAQVLAEVMGNTRNLARFYLSKLKGKDEFHRFELEGKKLNSIYWLIAHLVWSENTLILAALGGPKQDLAWTDHFGIGSTMPEKEALPPFKEVIDAFKQVHEITMTFLPTVSNEELDQDNLLGMGFGGDNSKRMMVHHCIRHEAQHIGHLSTLCKLFGEETP